jgi:predicted enzyme related to lactoylglutathione lyase
MPFSRYELRTKDPATARAFYASVLGADVELDVTELPERARAAGAPSHWLGHIAGDIERVLAAGAQRIHGNIVRDPLGAVLGVAGPNVAPPRAPVVAHQLNTTDVARAQSFYSSAFGWTEADLAKVTFTDFATRPGVHVSWLFHLRVADLDAVVDAVKSHGGLVAGVFDLPDGERLAVCDDPQGAFIGFRGR